MAEPCLAALKQGLIKPEMNRPRREDAFLHHPAPRVEGCVLNAVIPEVVFDELEVVVGEVPFGTSWEADQGGSAAGTGGALGK